MIKIFFLSLLLLACGGEDKQEKLDMSFLNLGTPGEQSSEFDSLSKKYKLS